MRSQLLKTLETWPIQSKQNHKSQERQMFNSSIMPSTPKFTLKSLIFLLYRNNPLSTHFLFFQFFSSIHLFLLFLFILAVFYIVLHFLKYFITFLQLSYFVYRFLLSLASLFPFFLFVLSFFSFYIFPL